jgi:hypothetical protein
MGMLTLRESMSPLNSIVIEHYCPIRQSTSRWFDLDDEDGKTSPTDAPGIANPESVRTIDQSKIQLPLGIKEIGVLRSKDLVSPPKM